jgi:RNA polymerase sigma factor (sigma-70 family)
MMDFQGKPDKELVKLALSGSKEAFGILYDRYFDYVFRVLQRKAGRIMLVKDMAQESFLRAYLCLEHLKKPESFQSWLHGITLNVYREYLRDKNASHLSFETITGGCSAEALLPSAMLLDPQEMAECSELRQIILKAVDSLSPNLRQPILLYYYDNLSLREIALRMNLSGNAIKLRLHRGRLYLREILYRLFMQYSFDNYLELWRKKVSQVSVYDVVKIKDESGEHPAVLLFDDEQKKILPIYLGESEAMAIALGVKKREMPRPMTFDLIASLLEAGNVEIQEVLVESLKDSTFYAVIKIRAGDEEKDIDARPSDAIALALRTESPIYVSEQVMNRASVQLSSEKLKEKTTLKGLKDLLDTIERTTLPTPWRQNIGVSFKSLITDEQMDLQIP